ncbi:hypothetical protein BKA63DRAFT_525983 [Paraphoma chrysanthemicola]|nr:hypothetical protein BKA63DRAFT_525983 [Paraphoma chrysanthemicola]
MRVKFGVFFILLCALWIYNPFKRFHKSQCSSSHCKVRGNIDLNATLGFEKIFAINLPSRSDRRDALQVMAATTDIKLEFSRAVRGEQVEEVALVFGRSTNEPSIGSRGSWRSHLNVIRSVVEHRLSTTLILEDDVDWDVRLREQMSYFWSNFGQDWMHDWDVLWLGHLGETFDPADPGLITFHDPTLSRSLADFYLKSTTHLPPQTRGVHPSNFPLGTFAYAVSYHGAQKILYQIGLNSTVAQYDNALALSCQTVLNCISVTPGLFHDYKQAGKAEKQSTSSPHREEDTLQEMFSENMGMSVRRYIRGELGKKNRYPKRPLSETEIVMRWSEAVEGRRFST